MKDKVKLILKYIDIDKITNEIKEEVHVSKSDNQYKGIKNLKYFNLQRMYL